MMDLEKGKSLEIEDWMKELLPDVAANVRIGGGVILPSSGLCNYNQQNKAIAAMTSNNNNNPSMWQHPQYCTSDNLNNSSASQRMAGSSVPTLFEQFSQNQTSSNMASNLHQHHQLLQNQLLDQQRPNTYQSPMQSNSYPSNFRQQRPVQISPGCHSSPALVAKHQEKFNVIQQMNDQMALMKKSLERQSGLLLPEQRGHPELLHMSTFHQAQNVTLVDQLKPGNPSQTMRFGNLQALSESTPQPELTNSIDWADQAYHKILQMKEMFLSEILTLYKRTQEMRNSANSAETVSRCEKIRISIERIFTFLHMSRSDILCWKKEKLFQTMNDVAKYVSQAKASNAHALMKQNQQVCSENVYSQFNNSTQPSFSHSIMKSNRKDFQTGFDQRALRMLLHPTYQHNNNNNNNNLASNDIFNQSDCSATVSFKAQSSVTVSPPLQNKQQNYEAAMKRQKRKEGTKLRRFVRSNQISPCDISPQSSQQSNSQLQIKDLSSKFSKSATSSSASPSPLTPSSKPADCAKSPLCLEEETSRFPKDSDAPPLQDKSQNLVVTGTLLGVMNSGENTESKQLSRGEGDPVKCLVDVVKSMSSRGLDSAIQDINAVTNLSDRIAANFLHDESTKVVLQDLADDISNFTRRKLTTKDQLETTTSNEMKTDQMEFCASGEVGRLKKERSDLLLQEITEINQRYMEVKVDVMNWDDVSRIGSDEGIPIRCSYIPVGPSQQLFPKLLLDLIVPADYPNVAPIVSETTPPGCGDSEEGDLWTKAKSNFSLKLSEFSPPISLKQMAKAWEVCARKVFLEFAVQMGGGSFSSRYGKW